MGIKEKLVEVREKAKEYKEDWKERQRQADAARAEKKAERQSIEGKVSDVREKVTEFKEDWKERQRAADEARAEKKAEREERQADKETAKRQKVFYDAEQKEVEAQQYESDAGVRERLKLAKERIKAAKEPSRLQRVGVAAKAASTGFVTFAKPIVSSKKPITSVSADPIRGRMFGQKPKRAKQPKTITYVVDSSTGKVIQSGKQVIEPKQNSFVSSSMFEPVTTKESPLSMQRMTQPTQPKQQQKKKGKSSSLFGDSMF